MLSRPGSEYCLEITVMSTRTVCVLAHRCYAITALVSCMARNGYSDTKQPRWLATVASVCRVRGSDTAVQSGAFECVVMMGKLTRRMC
jgi:hypothetical protein